MKNHLKILELATFSAGGCGVWARVRQEAELLSKHGYEVRVFSSNFIKGSNEIAPANDKIGNVKIQRFPAKKLGGESFMQWNFEKAALEFQPDIIIAHSYRHTHTTKALKIAKQLKKQGKSCKVFLVTHAPFERTRSKAQSLAVKIYDRLVGRRTLNRFDKILAITHWEISYLEKLGAKKEKIVYLPNGIPDEFFTQKPSREENKILSFGRISPIKDFETLILSVPYIGKSMKIEIAGPAEEKYLKKLKALISEIGLGKNISFTPAIYDLKKKIQKFDSCRIFVLPSKSEGMPQALVEAMARGKIVIASNNLGNADLVQDSKNGYLFQVGNEKALADKINLALSRNSTGKQAKSFAKQFALSKIIKKLEALF